MKIHTVFVTHNRLELTKRSILSYLQTVSLPYSAIVVDNASGEDTQEWLKTWCTVSRGLGLDVDVMFLPENRYPGFACNRGWEKAPLDAELLQRADNDFEFLPGWCDEVERMFRNRRLGQLGMRTDEEELFSKSNVGGNNIIRRSLWDKGLRYDERSWPQIRDETRPGYSEDTFFSPAVKEMGYRWDRVEKTCIVNIDEKDRDDPYYQRSFEDRGIDITLWT